MLRADQGYLENQPVFGETASSLGENNGFPPSRQYGGRSRSPAASAGAAPAVHDCFYSSGTLQVDAAQRDVESWLSERCPKAGFRIVLMAGAGVPRYTVLIDRCLHISRESAQVVWRNLVQAVKSRWKGAVELPATPLGMR